MAKALSSNPLAAAASDDIAPGKSGGLGVDVELGDYSFLCAIPGHAEDAMVGGDHGRVGHG